jgi:signal transduction histidine kinase
MSPERRVARRVSAAIIVVLGLAALVVAVYAVIVLVLGRAPVEGEQSLLVWSVVATAVAVALAFPVHRRLSAIGRRVVFSGSGAADEAVRTFGSRASRSVPLDDLLLQAAESLRTSLGLTSAELWVVAGDALSLKISDPERRRAAIALGTTDRGGMTRSGVSGPAWLRVWLPELLADRGDDPVVRAAPFVNAGEFLGMLLVQRPDGAHAFTDDEDLALGELARQIGMTLHNARLDSALQSSLDEVRRQARELQASRARIVEAADTARRHIERDIHDGVQQHLVALAVKVRLIKQLQARNPDKAAELLNSLGGDLNDTLQELRDLAHGIYPPLLADKGLAEALASAARRAVLPTAVEATGIRRYSRVVEATAYFCCLEAFQNAAKYAGEGVQVRVSVREEGDALVFAVTDDGTGFDPRAAARGGGFTTMNDRLGAVGGTLRVESTPGTGTRVTGVIPLRGLTREAEPAAPARAPQ